MESEEAFDIAMLTLYHAKTDDRRQELVSKFIPLFLESMTSTNIAVQKKSIKSINDILVFTKSHTEVQVPLVEIVDLLLSSRSPVQKNVTIIFIKLALTRIPKKDSISSLQKMMSVLNTLPPAFQPVVVTSYLGVYDLIDPKSVIETLSIQGDLILKLDMKTITGLADFVSHNVLQFAGYEPLFVALFLQVDVNVVVSPKLNGEKLCEEILRHWPRITDAQTNRTMDLLVQLEAPFPVAKVFERRHLKNALKALDTELTNNSGADFENMASELSEFLMVNLNDKYALSSMRTLLKKCHTKFVDNFLLFKRIFSTDLLDRESKTALLALFATFINATDEILHYLEDKVMNGELFGLSLLRQIFPYDAPRPRVLACLLIADPNYADECRLLLSPYQHSVYNGVRSCVYDQKAVPPTTSALFCDIIQDKHISQFLLQESSDRCISALFDFACTCVPTYPIPYGFILNCLSVCSNSAVDISRFLVYVSKTLPNDDSINTEPFIAYLLRESDPSIVESLAQFLEWTKAKFDVDSVAEKLKKFQKIAFLAHFGSPFDDSMKLLSTPGYVNLGKNCLMAMAKRKILDASHFDILFPLLSNDSYGIEILSAIASKDQVLCEKLVTRLFEPPLVTTDRVEIIVAGARSLCEIIDESIIMKLVENGVKSENARRNSAIFLLYLINRSTPQRLWFATRTLLYCSGAENGIVRTVGLIGLNLLYRKAEQKEFLRNTILGKEKVPGEEAQFLTGQPRAQVILSLLKISQHVEKFCELVLALIEPEYLIFPGVDIPKPDVEGYPYAAKFYYFSFSPNEDVAVSFRRLWRWATDGGKRLSIPEIIGAIDTDQDSWDAQQMNLNCMHDVVQRMTSEQMQEHFIELTTLTMKMVYSPVQKLSIAGVGLLDKMVAKCGNRINQEVKSFILKLSAELFDSRQVHLTALATKWCNDFIQLSERIQDIIIIYRSLFTGLSTSLSVAQMLMGDTWTAFTKSVFRSTDLDLSVFFDEVIGSMNSMYVLESQRYAIYYVFDAIVRSPKRTLIAHKVADLIPRLFIAITAEKVEIVLNLMVSALQHAIACVYHGTEEVYVYDDFLYRLYFEDDRPDVVASLLKMICLNSPECLRKSVSPLVLFASTAEQNSKPFAVILRDEIAIRVEVNSSPDLFVNFALQYGVNNTKMAFKPMGCKALLSIVENMKDEIRSKYVSLIDTICKLLDGRLWPSKECLIDVITLLIPYLDSVSDQLLAMIEKQTMRQKSVFRAAAFRCILEIHKRREIHLPELMKAMVDAMTNGIIIAQKASAACLPLFADTPEFTSFIELTYTRLLESKDEDLPEFAKLILTLPPHEVPPSFDPEKLKQKASGLATEAESVAELIAKF